MVGKCIVCEADNEGFPVIEDSIIRAIRAVKQKLGVAKGNKLVVCNACVEQYKKKRADFEQALVRYGLIGAFLLVLLVIVPPLLGGTFNLASIAMGILLALLIFAFSIFRYYPAADLSGYRQPVQESAQPKKLSESISSFLTKAAQKPQPKKEEKESQKQKPKKRK